MATKSIAAFALLVACAPVRYPDNPVHVEYEVVIDTSFTDAEAEIVARGITDWADATDNLVFKMYQAPCEQYRPAQSICVEAIHTPCGHDDWWGCWLKDARSIAIDKWKLTDEELRIIAAHEMGHALGLHHGKRGTAMGYRADLMTLPTCVDIERFWKQYEVRGRCKL